MTFKELPSETKKRLLEEQAQLHKKNVNTPYCVRIYNFLGTRYFYARRVCEAWSDDKGNSMPFGGGTHWVIAYGAVAFARYRNPVGEIDYELVDGRMFSNRGDVCIPKRLATKKEVMALIKAIGVINDINY